MFFFYLEKGGAIESFEVESSRNKAGGSGDRVRALSRPRKVRASQSKALGNSQEAQAYGKCNRKYTAGVRVGKGEMVR